MVQELAAELAGGSRWRGECLLASSDGRSFPVFLSVDPLKDGDGTVMGGLVIAHELSEEQREALRGTIEHFRELAENIRELFFVMITEPLRFAYISPAYEEMWGRPRVQLEASPESWMEPVHPDDRERVSAGFRQSMQCVKTEMEYRLVRPNGELRWIHSRTWPVLQRNSSSTKLVGIAEDITQRKDAEEQLRRAHENLNIALQEAEQRTREATQLTELLEILQSCQTVDEAYEISGKMLPAIVAASGGALCITSSSRNVIEAVTRWGDHVACDTTFAPQSCWALRRGKVHRVDDTEAPLQCAHQSVPRSDGYACIPLAAHGETLGLFYLQVSFPPNASTAARVQQMNTVVRQGSTVGQRISLALANLRLRDSLRSQSVRDPLTGLFNRRYMEECLERELRRAIRNGYTVALLMLDIDHFKQFNDTFGHQAGDTVLRAFGDLLQQRTRGQDVACRFGGEEFAIVLAGANAEAACKRAELLRAELKDLSVQHAGQVLRKITVSIGIALFPDHAEASDTLIQAADQALYRAKAEGRDRSVLR